MRETVPADRSAEREEPAGRMVIETDREFIHAVLSLYPNESGAHFTLAGVTELLKRLGITRQIDVREVQALIDQVATTRQPVEQVVIASGREPVTGMDASIEYPALQRHSRRETDSKDPVELTRRRIVNVKAGEVVAVHHPLTNGVPGVNLRGEYLSAEPGTDTTPTLEDHLRREGDSIIAEIDGRLAIEPRTLRVDEQVTVDGDLTILCEDIDFIAGIVVWGNVESGLTIRCGKDMTVGGSILGSSIECAGSLEVGNGIVGAEGTLITVKGDLDACFVENAVLRVWGDCRVRDSVVSSTILCSGKFEMSGAGHFVSGQVSAKEGASLSLIGIPVGTKVRLSVGTDMLAFTCISEIEAEIEAAGRRLAKIVEIEGQFGPRTLQYERLSARRRAEVDRWLQLLPAIETSIREAQRERARLLQRVKRNYDATVQVRKQVHEDTVIEFPLGRLVVRPASTAVRFVFDYGYDRVMLQPLAAA